MSNHLFFSHRFVSVISEQLFWSQWERLLGIWVDQMIFFRAGFLGSRRWSDTLETLAYVLAGSTFFSFVDYISSRTVRNFPVKQFLWKMPICWTKMFCSESITHQEIDRFPLQLRGMASSHHWGMEPTTPWSQESAGGGLSTPQQEPWLLQGFLGLLSSIAASLGEPCLELELSGLAILRTQSGSLLWSS